MIGVYVWLKNDVDPPVFWPHNDGRMHMSQVRKQQLENAKGWIFMGNYALL